MKKRGRLHPALARYKALQEQRTRVFLHEALDRFEHGTLKELESGSNLTHRNLAIEGGLAKDTAFSRYRKGHEKEGAFRFPEIVERYRKLRARKPPQPRSREKDRKIDELRLLLKERDEEIIMLKRNLNRLDAENLDLKALKQKLEEEIAVLRRGTIRKIEVRGKR